ncbi:hypothetical protein GEMRC1_002985 [Eukaryota sp. GEM-RC1]
MSGVADNISNKLPSISSDEEFSKALKLMDILVYICIGYSGWLVWAFGVTYLGVSFITALVNIIVYGILAAGAFAMKLLIAQRDHEKLKLVSLIFWGIAAYSIVDGLYYGIIAFGFNIGYLLQKVFHGALVFVVAAQAVRIRMCPFYLSASSSV